MAGWADEQDEVQFSEPVMAKKDCKVRIDFAEGVVWTVKAHVPGHEGEAYKALKLAITITDEQVQTEHTDAKPRLTLEHQFNIERYPYLDKKTGAVKWLGRDALYQLEEAFGFEPIFVDAAGNSVEPYIAKTGRKLAPKIEGVKRKLNPDFAAAYFTSEGEVRTDSWIDKEVYADIEIEQSEKFGDKNVIKRFKLAPVAV